MSVGLAIRSMSSATSHAPRPCRRSEGPTVTRVMIRMRLNGASSNCSCTAAATSSLSNSSAKWLASSDIESRRSSIGCSPTRMMRKSA